MSLKYALLPTMLLFISISNSHFCEKKAFANSVKPQFVNKQPCNKLPQIFHSYNEALTLVRSSEFELSESINTSKSSWIRGASYYSCDGEFGFLILSTDSKDYIHKNVPLSIWNAFKNAESFGSYYSRNIKDKYMLTIK